MSKSGSSNFYFQIFEQTIRSEQIIEFLKHLLRYIEGNILVIWDRLPAHKSAVTQQFIRDQNGRLEMEYLPPYAPELNPVEYIWAHCKHHELPNDAAGGRGQRADHDLGTGAGQAGRGMMFRNPVPVISETIGQLGEVEGVAQGVSGISPLRNRGLI